MKTKPSRPLSLIQQDFKILRCSNRCVFCFVDQMPKGLRPTLYIKDEDYRLSFLHGAYITATGLTPPILLKIFNQRLTPLYISVHSTDENIRRHLLGRPDIPPILPILKDLAENDISFHTQIVVCPGINDGPDLESTIQDLAGLRPALLSIAVVPVGLTKHRKGLPRLKAFTPPLARKILSRLIPLQKRIKELFMADEIYIQAERPFPPAKAYADYPQLENGVGMMRKFMEEFKSLPASGRDLGIITGVSAFPFIKKLFKPPCKVIPVQNRLMGKSVTVTGLLSGKDILDAIKGKPLRACIIPPNCLNVDGLTLDGHTLKTLSEQSGIQIQLPKIQ